MEQKFIIGNEIVTKREFEIFEERKKGCIHFIEYKNSIGREGKLCLLIPSEGNKDTEFDYSKETECDGSIKSQYRCPFWNK